MIRRPPTSTRAGPTGRSRRQGEPRSTTLPLRQRLGWALLFLGAMAGLVWVLWPIFSILLAAAAFAYLLDPIADRMEERGYSRNTGIALIFMAAALGSFVSIY